MIFMLWRFKVGGVRNRWEFKMDILKRVHPSLYTRRAAATQIKRPGHSLERVRQGSPLNTPLINIPTLSAEES